MAISGVIKMNQENKKKESTKTEEKETVEVEEAPQGAETEVDDDEVDDLLDEIDSVLESNAEQFVTSFVQKGGE